MEVYGTLGKIFMYSDSKTIVDIHSCDPQTRAWKLISMCSRKCQQNMQRLRNKPFKVNFFLAFSFVYFLGGSYKTSGQMICKCMLYVNTMKLDILLFSSFGIL